MDKKELRKHIRDQKRAMSEDMIVAASQSLAAQFYATSYYQNTNTIYGYLPYNQEVRTVPMLEQALRDGKKWQCLRFTAIQCALSIWTTFLRSLPAVWESRSPLRMGLWRKILPLWF